MKLRFISAAVGAVLAVFALIPAVAAAATEFGDNCSADRGSGSTSVTLFGLSSASPLPLAVPSAGVITSWKLHLTTPEPVPAIIPQTLKVLRLDAAAKTARVIGEASGNIGSGPNTVPARISVQAGDRLGLFGSGLITYKGSTGEVGTLFCEESAGPTDVFGVFAGGASVGGSAAYEESNGFRVPAVAVLEPDADNDGFGDETQDQCPQSASAQVACPVVTLSTTKQVRKGSVVIVVTTDTPAPVTVNGTVKLGKGKKATLKGGTANLTPGVLGKFTLKFTKKVKAKLAQLSRKQSLTLRATVTATNVAGQVSSKVVKAKLKGRAKG
jgi:hypothetical protein